MSKPKYYNGKTLTEWANECGIKRTTLSNRIKEGWTIEEAISIPYGGKRSTEKSIAQLAIENKVSPKTLKKRITDGMTIEEALLYNSRKNYVGQKSGKLLVIDELPQKRDPNGRARRLLLCLCDCGETKEVTAESFSSGNTLSCGCYRRELSSKRKEKNLIGKKFHRLLVESEAYRDRRGIHWNCICDCGNKCVVTSNNLIKGNTKSCGCYNKERVSETERKDITNQRFYRLVAEECVGKNEHNNYLWRCKCDCGREVITTAARLLGGQIISCGCIKSKGECIIEDYLLKNKIVFKKNKYFSDLKQKTYLYFDFCIFDKNNNYCLIEYQGEQHYIDTGIFGKQQREITDKMKKDYCKKNNIPLYEIRFDENIINKMNEIVVHVNPVLSE